MPCSWSLLQCSPSLYIEPTIQFDPIIYNTTENVGVTVTLRLTANRPIPGRTLVRVVNVNGTGFGMSFITLSLSLSLSLSLPLFLSFSSLPLHLISFPTSAANDYVAFNKTIRFHEGATEQTLVVNIVDDDEFELPERLQARLTLVDGKGVRIGKNDLATININDDDGMV